MATQATHWDDVDEDVVAVHATILGLAHAQLELVEHLQKLPLTGTGVSTHGACRVECKEMGRGAENKDRTTDLCMMSREAGTLSARSEWRMTARTKNRRSTTSCH